MLTARARSWYLQLTARRHRRVLIAFIATLLISATLLGLIGFSRWRGRQAVQSDTRTVISQTGRQLIRALQSRRGTLTFLRDTLNRRPNLSDAQLKAMGQSGVEHTRHMLGVGMIRAGKTPTWWAGPAGLTAAEAARLDRTIAQRTRLRGIWRVPSTFATTAADGEPILVMLDPLRQSVYPDSAIVGVFNVKLLLEDFFASNLSAHYPVQLLDEHTVLYRSDDWKPPEEHPDVVVAEHPLALDATRWTIQMQPGQLRVVQALSWSNFLLIGLSLIAGIGVIGIVWILAARTWILQRAVDRRTAALRRALQRVRQMAITDELTGLYNRRFFLTRWEWECERAKRYRRPLACLMIDVNGFKQVNDRLGHLVGDIVLKRVAQELKELMRTSDILARFGGDEFVAALPETTDAQAESVAEKLRQVAIPLDDLSGDQLLDAPPITLSVGMSRIEQPDESPEQVLEAADKSLYAHKRRSREATTGSPA
jgi:diguanylate cyclase (GGDEF)-like protein